MNKTRNATTLLAVCLLPLHCGQGTVEGPSAQATTKANASTVVIPMGLTDRSPNSGSTTATTDRVPPQPPPPATPPPPPPIVLGPSALEPNSLWLTYVGRFDLSNPNVSRAAFAGSAIKAMFRGTSLTVNLAEEIGTAPTDPAHNWFNINLDGNVTMVQLGSGTTSFLIADKLTGDTNHTVTLSKRTDASIGVVDFLGMQTSSDGNFLLPPAPQGRRIEVVGASETSGFGMDGNVYGCTGSGFYQAFNADEAYAEQAGALLQADVINLGYPCKGIVKNCAAADNIKNIPFMYMRSLPDDANAPAWDFANWQADLVIVDTGGTDLTIANVDPNTFMQGLLTFLQTIRQKYPHGHTVLALDTLYQDTDGDPFRTDLAGYFSQVISRAKDPNLTYFSFPVYYDTYMPPNEPDGFLACGHPNPQASAANAALLASMARTLLHW